jgi:hypothetical protein
VTRRWLALLVPVVLTAAVYAPVRRFDFVELDDPYYVTHNAELADAHGVAALGYAFTTFTGGNWHPLVWLSFFADRDLYHLSPGPMHLENGALHAASGVLVLLLLLDATGRLGRATVCAAVFAVHPMHVESVAWVSERKDALSTVWLLAAAWAYVRYARAPFSRPACGPRSSPVEHRGPQSGRLNGSWWYAASLACYALSLSAKSMGVTLPAVLLLLDGWPLRRWQAWPRVREKLPMLAMAVAAAATAWVAQRSVGATHAIVTTPAERLGNAATSMVRYVADLFWPSGLAAFYPFRPVPPTAAFAAAGLLVAITVIALRLRRRRPYLLVGWLWFAGSLLPVSGIVQVGMAARADRYVYFPSIGLSVAVVWLAADVLPAARWVGLVAVAALAVAGRRQVETWRDTRTLFTHAVAVTDGNYLAYDDLALDDLRRGDLPAALDSLDSSLAARDDFAPAHAHLAHCWMVLGEYGKARGEYARATQLAPDVSDYRRGLADAISSVDRTEGRRP